MNQKAIRDPNRLVNDNVDEIFVRAFDQMMKDYREQRDTRRINDKQLIALVAMQVMKESRKRIDAIFAEEERQREEAKKNRKKRSEQSRLK